MNSAFLDTLAHVHELPSPVAQRVAATVAKRCALIANRYCGARASDADSVTDLVGSQIGAAILAEFELPDGAKW